ncbi:MAG: O-methyltransferase [Chloroflexi bacterium]|nr:O-methyltransferase [Chloroflexota bacterium]
MNIVEPSIDEYLNKTLPVGDALLREMQRYGESCEFPMVGPQVGRLLYVLARSIGATRVLELGSGFGYSAMWFARALGANGRIVLTERSKENAKQARGYFQRARLLDHVQIEVGNALDIIGQLPGLFDVIFNDVDKPQYPCILDLARPKLRLGGLFISDNMLWHGTVLDKSRKADVRGVKELTRALLAAPDFVTTILPVRDGVAVALKIA